MKCQLAINLLTATLIITPMLVGCKKNPQRPTPIPGIAQEAPSGGRSEMLIPPTKPVDDGNRTDVKPMDPNAQNLGGTPLDPNGPKTDWPTDGGTTFKDQVVYFDFDKSTVKASERPKLETIARRMKDEFQGQAIRVQGHCDERGTEEYNRALGERRALAVREVLISLGMSANMVETISYGEDKPEIPGHNEAAWSKNRRALCEKLTPPAGGAASK